MKTVKSLASATNDTKQGNHRVVFNAMGFIEGIRDFYYYSTIICGVNDNKRTFYIDATYGTQSTTRACNAYRKHFVNLGYTEVSA